MNPLARVIVYCIVSMIIMITLSCERLKFTPTSNSDGYSSALLHQLNITLDTDDVSFTGEALGLLNKADSTDKVVITDSFVYEREAVPGYDVLSLLIEDTTTTVTLMGRVKPQVRVLETEYFSFDGDIKKVKRERETSGTEFTIEIPITRANNTDGPPEPMLLRFKRFDGTVLRSIQILPVYNKESKHVYDYIGALGQDEPVRYSRWERNVDMDTVTSKHTFTIYYDPEFIPSTGNTAMHEWALTSGFLGNAKNIQRRKIIRKDREWTRSSRPESFVVKTPRDTSKSKEPYKKIDVETLPSPYELTLEFKPLFVTRLGITGTSSSTIPVLNGILQYPPSTPGLFAGVNKNTGITAGLDGETPKTKTLVNDYADAVAGNYLYDIQSSHTEESVGLPDKLQGNEELLITPYTSPQQFTPNVTSRIVKRYKIKEGFEPTLTLYGSEVRIEYKTRAVPLVNDPALGVTLSPFTSIYINEKTASIILFYTSVSPPKIEDITFTSPVGRVDFNHKTLTLSTGNGEKEYPVAVVSTKDEIKIRDVRFDVDILKGRPSTNFSTYNKNVIIDGKTIVLILPHGIPVNKLHPKSVKVIVTLSSGGDPLHGVELESSTISVDNTTSPPTFDLYKAVVDTSKPPKLITSTIDDKGTLDTTDDIQTIPVDAHTLTIRLGTGTDKIEKTYTILAGTIGLKNTALATVAGSESKCSIQKLTEPIKESLKLFESDLKPAYTIVDTKTYIGDSKIPKNKVPKDTQIIGKIFLAPDKRVAITQGNTEKHYKIQSFEADKYNRICLY